MTTFTRRISFCSNVFRFRSRHHGTTELCCAACFWRCFTAIALLETDFRFGVNNVARVTSLRARAEARRRQGTSSGIYGARPLRGDLNPAGSLAAFWISESIVGRGVGR
jgi:hypothetical protein